MAIARALLKDSPIIILDEAVGFRGLGFSVLEMAKTHKGCGLIWVSGVLKRLQLPTRVRPVP